MDHAASLNVFWIPAFALFSCQRKEVALRSRINGTPFHNEDLIAQPRQREQVLKGQTDNSAPSQNAVRLQLRR